MATAVGRTGFQMYMTAVLRRLHFYGELSTAEVKYWIFYTPFEFGPKKALAHIPLQASECKSLLAEVLFHTKGNGQVASICRAALSEIEMDARKLN